MPAVHETIHAPEFIGDLWLNSLPLTMAGLRGRVVLVDFWDYTCINCVRTLPYVREWWRRYRDHGLTIVGIHSPEFSFAHNADYVAIAVQQLKVEYPVFLDNEHQNWRAWATRYWPSKYLVDADGCIRYFHYGEGDYQGFEMAIQSLLSQIEPQAVFPPPVPPLRATDEPGAVCHRSTPELYLGYRRGRIGNPGGLHPDQVTAYADPGEYRQEFVYLSGHWLNEPEAMTLADGTGTLTVQYLAKEVHVVMSPPPLNGEGIVMVEQDGAPLDRDAMGADVHPEAGDMVVRVDMPRMYSLVTNPEFGKHTLRLRILTPGLSAYSFTFVTECIGAERREEEAA